MAREVCQCCGRPMPRKDRSAEIEEAVRRYSLGEKARVIAEEMDIPSSTITQGYWLRRQRGEVAQRPIAGRGRRPKAAVSPTWVNSVFALGAM